MFVAGLIVNDEFSFVLFLGVKKLEKLENMNELIHILLIQYWAQSVFLATGNELSLNF